MNNTATSERSISITILLTLLMIFLGISAATGGLNKAETTDLSDQNDVRNTILPLSQLNEPGSQEGSIFTDTTLSSGSGHTCAILDNGAVSCWGKGYNGQLGNGATSDKSTPTLTNSLGTGRTAVALSSGGSHTCAILDNGAVSCWGGGSDGQLGNGATSDKSTPTLTSSLGTGRTAVALSSGNTHTCAILDNGAVSCWGYGNYGRLGNGGTSDKTRPTLTSSLGTGRTAVALSSGGYHTCAILDNGAVSCWGYGGDGQLGNGGTSDKTTPTLTSSLGAGRTAVALSSGDAHTCAILDNGAVSCWGDGFRGRLGNGATSDKLTPTITSSLGTGRTAVALSSGGYHTCAILDNGSVSCWGYGGHGQLGNGGTGDKTTPTLTSSLGAGRTAVAISSGSYHTCAILDNGAVSCWGYGNYGQLGNGGTSDKTTPTLTSSLGTGRTAALSERDFDGDGTFNIFQAYSNLDYRESTLSSGVRHTCAILDNGAVSCWGRGFNGRLGNGGTGDKTTPTLTSSLGTGRTAVALSSGDYHTCAILDNGAVSCWGEGSNGQLGNGGTYYKTTPTLTSSLGTGRTAVALSSGSAHTCAILDNGSVSCWGEGSNGQLGNGGTYYKTTPTLTSSLGTGRTAVAISSGNYHTCAILDNGAVSCWGRGDDGQLGNGGTSDKTTPTLTSSLGAGRTAVAISSGSFHTCAILDNGAVSCWGNGYYGQLGNGGNSDKTTPTLTSSLGAGRTAVAISSGSYHTCAILDNGRVSCWGGGNYGQLGNGGTSDKTTPTLTSSLGTGRTAVALSSGLYHTCAILDNGAVSCWGRGNYGQLGNGGTSTITTPMLTSSLGTGRTALLIDGDKDGDGVSDHFDSYPGDSIRSIKCDAGQFGRYRCVDAPLGKFVPSSGSMYATAASPGYFVSSAGQTSATACSPGYYQASSGQTSCDAADAGYYVSGTAQTSQTACAAGNYNPSTGSSSSSACADADAGYYVPSSGQSNQTACAVGTYQSSTGQSSCDDADAGHYVSGTAQTSQTACAAGTYQASTGQSSCDDADAGYYVSGTAQTSQTACAAGTFSSTTGSISCTDALPGYYVPVQGQPSATECLIGYYQSASGQTSCDIADIGYYVDQMGQSSQTQCPTSTTTVATGSTSSLQCLSDHDGDQTVDALDDDDDNDGVDDINDLCQNGQSTLTSDNDGDGCDDSTEDADDDNDGVLDGDDDLPLDSSESLDTDDDGTGNNADPDDDGDSVLDSEDVFPLDETESFDTDGDGVGNNADTDDDGDGVIDAEDAFPLDSTETLDTDNDGTGDNADSDDDGDGVEDTLDEFPLDSAESVDLDGDGIGSNADTDDDGDGVEDAKDVFPEDATEWEDVNGDGLGDNKEPLSSFERAQQEPVLPLLGIFIVIVVMIMLYRAQPPVTNPKEK